MSEVAASVQVPRDMPGLLALCVVGAAAASRFDVDVGNTHQEPLNLYVAVVASSGARKSEVMRNMVFPLHEVEIELAEEAKPAIAQAEARYRIEDARLKELTRRAGREEDPIKRDQLAAEADSITAKMPEIPSPPRLLADDVTPERLATLAAENDGCLATFSTEGGVFGMMAGRYNERGGPNLDIYLKGTRVIPSASTGVAVGRRSSLVWC